MKMIEYIYTAMFLIALILLFFAYKQYNNTANILVSGTKTKAKVIDLITVNGDKGYKYKPVYEYTKNGKTITYTSNISSNPPPYKIGDLVPMVYTKDSDKIKIMSFWGLYRWTIILMCIAAPLLIVGGGYVLYSRG